MSQKVWNREELEEAGVTTDVGMLVFSNLPKSDAYTEPEVARECMKELFQVNSEAFASLIEPILEEALKHAGLYPLDYFILEEDADGYPFIRVVGLKSQ